MNTINTSQNSINLYTQKNIQAAKNLEQYKIEQQNKGRDDKFVKISQQALQALSNSTQIAPNINSPLDSLVASKTITQDQADAIKSAFESRGKSIQVSGTYNNKIKPENPLDSLVSSGTITEEQKESVKSEFESTMKANGINLHRPHRSHTHKSAVDPLESLVTSGTITEEQKETIKSAFQSAMKMDGSSLNASDESAVDALESLVTSGAITEEQKESIKSAFESVMKMGGLS